MLSESSSIKNIDTSEVDFRITDDATEMENLISHFIANKAVETIRATDNLSNIYSETTAFLAKQDNYKNEAIQRVIIVKKQEINEENIKNEIMLRAEQRIRKIREDYDDKMHRISSRYQLLLRRIEINKDEVSSGIFNTMIKTLLMNPAWKIRSLRGSKYLCYLDDIIPDKVIRGDQIYTIHPDKREWKVKNLRIPLTRHLEVVKASKTSNHPNIESAGSVCLGDLEGKQLYDSFHKLPELLQTINLNSAYFTPEKLSEDEIDETIIKEEENIIWNTKEGF